MNIDELNETLKEISIKDDVPISEMEIRVGQFGGMEVVTFYNGYEQPLLHIA